MLTDKMRHLYGDMAIRHWNLSRLAAIRMAGRIELMLLFCYVSAFVRTTSTLPWHQGSKEGEISIQVCGSGIESLFECCCHHEHCALRLFPWMPSSLIQLKGWAESPHVILSMNQNRVLKLGLLSDCRLWSMKEIALRLRVGETF